MIELRRLPEPQKRLLERVARAICTVDGRDPDRSAYPRSDGPLVSDVAIPEWRNYLPHAVAAAEAADSRREERVAAIRRVRDAFDELAPWVNDYHAEDQEKELRDAIDALEALDGEGTP